MKISRRVLTVLTSLAIIVAIVGTYFVFVNNQKPQFTPLTQKEALREGTILWTSIAENSRSVPRQGFESVMAKPTIIVPTPPDVTPPLPELPYAKSLQVYVISSSDYPEQVLLAQSDSGDGIYLLLAEKSSSNAPLSALAVAWVYDDVQFDAPPSPDLIAGHNPAHIGGPFVDFPPLGSSSSGVLPHQFNDDLPNRYLSYLSSYKNPENFVFTDNIRQQLVLYGLSSSFEGMRITGTSSLALNIVNATFPTSAGGKLRLFTLNQTLSGRPASGSCFQMQMLYYGVPIGAYATIDIKEVTLIVAEEHPDGTTHIIALISKTISATGTSCTDPTFPKWSPPPIPSPFPVPVNVTPSTAIPSPPG